ncbi:MAG: hypothetical protein ACQESC_02470 [Nanobdellota archaeon]
MENIPSLDDILNKILPTTQNSSTTDEIETYFNEIKAYEGNDNSNLKEEITGLPATYQVALYAMDKTTEILSAYDHGKLTEEQHIAREHLNEAIGLFEKEQEKSQIYLSEHNEFRALYAKMTADRIPQEWGYESHSNQKPKFTLNKETMTQPRKKTPYTRGQKPKF